MDPSGNEVERIKTYRREQEENAKMYDQSAAEYEAKIVEAEAELGKARQAYRRARALLDERTHVHDVAKREAGRAQEVANKARADQFAASRTAREAEAYYSEAVRDPYLSGA